MITLYASAATLSNAERSDYVVMGHWTAAGCPTRDGPPHGGQWAVVSIRVA